MTIAYFMAVSGWKLDVTSGWGMQPWAVIIYAMSTVEHQQPVVPIPTVVIPPLRDGDRLSRKEFERRYEAMPEVKKAELIEGIVYMPSAVRFRHHARPHLLLGGWVTYYLSKTPGLDAGDNASNRLSEGSEPQPDVMLFLPGHAGGAAEVDADDYVSGPPELICEVTASSKSKDLGPKKNAYCRYGVREYLVWRVEDREVDWFELQDSQYELLRMSNDGLLCSSVFPGLWLDVNALLAGDLPHLFAAVDRGTATEEHREFVRRLAASA
jgi:Uma2 family endonuclease